MNSTDNIQGGARSASLTDPACSAGPFVHSECETDARDRRLAEMEGIFSHVADAILVVKCDGRIIDANPAATMLFGYSKHEFFTMYPWSFVVDVPREEILSTIDRLKDYPADGGRQ